MRAVRDDTVTAVVLRPLLTLDDDGADDDKLRLINLSLPVIAVEHVNKDGILSWDLA